MEKIKLAMLTNDLNMNGISNVVMNYCKELDKRKFEIHIIAGTPVNLVYRKDAEENSITIWELPSRKQRSKQYYRTLWQVLRKEKFDIVHVHGNSATMTAELFLAWLSGTGIRIAHSHTTTSSNMRVHKMLYPLFSLLYTNGFACSEMAGKWLFHNRSFTVIPNGFHTESFIYNKMHRREIRKKLHIKETDFVIGHVGRFNPPKNHEFLLEVFEKIAEIKPDAWLLLVGDGPDFNRINQLIQKHRYHNRIIVYGEAEEMSKLYSAMDVFAFPSKFEGLGIVAVEAQISGLPCVVSDAVPRDILIGGYVYFLPLSAGADYWAETILECFFSDNDRSNYFYGNAELIRKYDISNSVRRLENIYSNLYGGK